MRPRSRKKQNASSSNGEQMHPTLAVPVRRQLPPPEVLQQLRKKHQDEVHGLTTKNYRLAKELADLRLKHRDECKNVTRLTMENMNLASRCREAISHVAMLKKELAMQQKRTAQALASQREQTKRMADSLTNSFIGFSSPESVGVGKEVDEDDTVTRLVSCTPSPNRVITRPRPKTDHENDKDKDDETKSFSKLVVVKSSTTITTDTTRPSSPTEETRDSPATTATNSPTTDLDEDDTVLDSIAIAASSTLSESPEKQKENLDTNEQKQQNQILHLPSVYSTPKKSERSRSPSFRAPIDRDGLFPISASPRVFNNKSNNSNHHRSHKLYDDEFPLDTVEQPETSSSGSGSGNHSKSQRKINLLTSIDAFEQSFSTDFPDSFTPKENNTRAAPSSGSGQRIYNPFFATPEKRKQGEGQPYDHSTPNEEERKHHSDDDAEYKTPPKSAKTVPVVAINDDDNTTNYDEEQLPKRPEKITPSAARARYEKALGSKGESTGTPSSTDDASYDTGKTAPSTESSNNDNSSGPTALVRRVQQKKRLDMNLEATSNGDGPVSESDAKSKSPSSDHHTRQQQPRKSIIDIVDAFEQTASENNHDGGGNNERKSSSAASRFQGQPIRSLRRRSVNKPISYAEPALNTKLRRGDTFFPKTGPLMTVSDADGSDDRSQAMAVVPPVAVVSP